MNDKQIVELYWQRDEAAVDQTARKYGRFCYKIAYNVLHNKEDSEESVNDTYVDAWKSIPPHRPNSLAAFLGKITRRISLDKFKKRSAEKRGGCVVTVTLNELEECISYESNIEKRAQEELSEAISSFLEKLKEDERNIFLRRYWFFDPIKEISRVYGFSESKVKTSLMRTREKLAEYLKKEGISI